MNIVILSRGKFPGFDGPYRRTKLFGSGFAKNGCDVTLIVAYPPEWKKCDLEFFEKNRFRYYHTLKGGLDNRSNLIRNIFHKIVGTFKVLGLYKKLMNGKKVDILFIYGIGFLELLIALILKIKYEVKIVIDKTDINYQFHKNENGSFWSMITNLSFHEFLSGLNIALGEFLIKRYVDIVFTVSSHLKKKYAVKVRGVVKMINPAMIESEAYNETADLLNICSDQSCHKLLAVCVTEGYFYGLFPFIEALGNLRSRHKFRLYVLGSDRGDYLEMLNAKLFEHGIHDVSTLFYKISDREVISLYKNADILLMAQASPTLAEGSFPSKISEYLISGKPIITTLFSDLDRYLEDCRNCLVVPYGDIHAYEGALCRLFDSKELCERLGREARKTCLESFDYIKGTKEILANMQEILFKASVKSR
jgi:glycosyltransferase involved in cell wall biosynthesis